MVSDLKGKLDMTTMIIMAEFWEVLSWISLNLHEDPMSTWMFPKVGVPQNGWFIMENPIKMDDLGVPLFLETPTW